MGWEAIEEMSLLTLPDELSALFAKEDQYASDRRGGGMEEEEGEDEEEEDDDDASAATAADLELRRTVCQWNYDCVDYFRFDREVVFWSMNYFDRYLAECRDGLRRRQRAPSGRVTHLVALSSLYLACKLHGHMEQDDLPAGDAAATATASGAWRRRKSILTVQEFCLMSRNTYCPQMLEDMEASILRTLRWMLHPPSTMDFLVRLVKLLPALLERARAGRDRHWRADKAWSVFEVARYQAELAVYSHELSHDSSASRVGLAAVLNALDSRVVSSSARETVVPRDVRDAFLEQVAPYYLVVGQAEVPDGEPDVVARLEIMVQRERSVLKSLCSKTIVLPALVVDDAPLAAAAATAPPDDASSCTSSFELPDISICDDADRGVGNSRGSRRGKRTGSGTGGSPVSVAAKLF
ncbi:hypothetical protein ACHAXS_006899 [Conticribra weissflogii]